MNLFQDQIMIAGPEAHCSDIENALVASGVYSPKSDDPANTWRISPEPFYLSVQDVAFFERLGGHLLSFYTALNRLYLDSAKGKMPAWIAEYLDAGKPSELLDLARMNRFKGRLPGILRPDVMVTDSGFAVTELDSVPGGFGVTAQLMTLYGQDDVVGATSGGIPELFYRMLEAVAGHEGCVAAIVVSDEAADYLNEMQYLGRELRERGHPVHVVHPRDVVFKEEGLFVIDDGREVALDVMYRFYELFDLKNIPKAELLAYSVKKGHVRATPPYKPYLEEKLSFALFHHPALQSWWEKSLGDETFKLLNHLIPSTWVLDSRPLPPHGVIPGLTLRGNKVNDWNTLSDLTQKERELVIKPSGFSPDAWGSRGVVVGHDVSAEIWQQSLDSALQAFPEQPHILQMFHKGKRFKQTFWNSANQSIETMDCRVRLTPYYFVTGEAAPLGGILATLCPQDKKKIHGMVDAVMVPCAAGK
ncbi:hypothetical protein [Nitrospina watsonii]|uniref:Uncharacterized protein n=1 Tax=Nitrospina watsonii TaxID=1323948 RepID=A0ABM9HGE0_9BACT|nr:hypothetical protein [Nitrospina watsonii]CAI2719253.1 conserved protein of unknown function [Nitrospina watsonii]